MTADVKPSAEWIRPADAKGFCGFGRAFVYKLIRDGLVRSVCIRQPHTAFGMRLISVQSLRDYIGQQADVPDDGKSRSRDYYSDNGRRGAKAKAEKAKLQNDSSKRDRAVRVE